MPSSGDLRKAKRCGHRILHLVDSQVVAAILAKGRSSSFRLQLALAKHAALVVASGTVVAVGYVDTRDNPSDIPSRWFDGLPLPKPYAENNGPVTL